MNNSSANAKQKIRKRIGHMFQDNKDAEKDKSERIKFDLNKEYNFIYHDRSFSELDVILNPDTFIGLAPNDFISLQIPNSELKLLFELTKENLEGSKLKSAISLNSSYNELIKKEASNKSTVYVRPAIPNDYHIDRLTLLFKESYLSRKDIFLVIKSLNDKVVHLNKNIQMSNSKKTESQDIANVKNIYCAKSKSKICGIITKNTDFQLRSSCSNLYFLIEISKETFDFPLCSQTKFEMILDFLKHALKKINESGANHQIKIIFFTRIFFESNKKVIQQRKIDFIYKSSQFKNEYFFDFYSLIQDFAIKTTDIKVIISGLYNAFIDFGNIFQETNLNNYIKNISNKYSTNSDLKLNSFGNFFEKDDLFKNLNINSFRFSKSHSINLFESINIILNDLKVEKRKLTELGSLITVISSGDFFPNYNTELSKFTKENLLESGIECNFVFLCSKEKAEHYQIREIDEGSIFELTTREERTQSLFSNYNPTSAINTVVNNTGTCTGSVVDYSKKMNDDYQSKSQLNRKISSDYNYNMGEYSYNKYEDNEIGFYKYENDVFTHKKPKWIHLFYIDPSSLKSNFDELDLFSFGLSSSLFFNRKSQNNNTSSHLFGLFSNYPNTSDVNNISGGGNNWVNSSKNKINCNYSPSCLDSELFNSKIIEQSEIERNLKEKEIFKVDLAEYKNLSGNMINYSMNMNNNINAAESPIYYSSGRPSRVQIIPQTRKESLKAETIEDVKEKFSIFKAPNQNSNFLSLNNNNNTHENVNGNSPKTIYNFNIIEEETKNSTIFDSLTKKFEEFDNQIFSIKRFSFDKLNSSPTKKSYDNYIDRDINLNPQYDNYMDSSKEKLTKLIEMLCEVPLLPMFGDFDTRNVKDDVLFAPYSISSLNNDISILEEIIYERINNNFQIVRFHNDDLNKSLDLKNLDSIHLFDRKYYHHIYVEDDNYKVKIFNYGNKINRGTASIKQLQLSTMINDLPLFDYNYAVLDNKYNFFKAKRLSAKIAERNEVFWSKYDVFLNDMIQNLKQMVFRNELSFLITDKCDFHFIKTKKVKKMTIASTNSNEYSHRMTSHSNFNNVYNNQGESLTNSPKSTFSSFQLNPLQNNSSASLNNNINININNNSNQFTKETTNMNTNASRHTSIDSKVVFIETNIVSNNEGGGEQTYHERFKKLILHIDNHLSRYDRFKDFFCERIKFIKDSSPEMSSSIINLDDNIDWLFVNFSSTFSEKNNFIFTIKWLSCNSFGINNFIKELTKKAKYIHIGLLPIPSDDIVLTNFSTNLFWVVSFPVESFIRNLEENYCQSFVKCNFDGNFLLFSDEKNLLIKISNKGLIVLIDLNQYYNECYNVNFIQSANYLSEMIQIYETLESIIVKLN